MADILAPSTLPLNTVAVSVDLTSTQKAIALPQVLGTGVNPRRMLLLSANVDWTISNASADADRKHFVLAGSQFPVLYEGPQSLYVQRVSADGKLTGWVTIAGH